MEAQGHGTKKGHSQTPFLKMVTDHLLSFQKFEEPRLLASRCTLQLILYRYCHVKKLEVYIILN